MKVITVFKLEKEDPNWDTQIDEALNRLMSFAPELRMEDSTERKAYNRVLTNKEFTLGDWLVLHAYGRTVAERAEDASAIQITLVRESIQQAANNLRDVMEQFSQWLKVQTHETQT